VTGACLQHLAVSQLAGWAPSYYGHAGKIIEGMARYRLDGGISIVTYAKAARHATCGKSAGRAGQ